MVYSIIYPNSALPVFGSCDRHWEYIPACAKRFAPWGKERQFGNVSLAGSNDPVRKEKTIKG